MDNLEKYIRDNRDNWNDRETPANAWERVEKELESESPKESNISGWPKMLMVLIGIGIAVTLFFVLKSADPVVGENELLQFAATSEYQETEQYYRSTIELNLVTLKNLTSDATLLEDLGQLDEIEKELRTEYTLAQGAYKEEILHALIINHQTKLGLLERMLEEIKNMKNENDEFL